MKATLTSLLHHGETSEGGNTPEDFILVKTQTLSSSYLLALTLRQSVLTVLIFNGIFVVSLSVCESTFADKSCSFLSHLVCFHPSVSALNYCILKPFSFIPANDVYLKKENGKSLLIKPQIPGNCFFFF